MKTRWFQLLGGAALVGALSWIAGCAATYDDDAADDDAADDDGADDDAADDDGADDDGADDDSGGDDDSTPTEEDAAEVVSVHLPTAMDCGDTFPAYVEMRNTGWASWTRDDGYKLGAVDDEDPFITGDIRVWLPEGVTVAPGDSHLFSFELVAPASASDYVTDWRMVREGVHWFGETAAETVTVDCPIQTFTDSLLDATLQPGFADKWVSGGSFTGAGWQTTGSQDQLLLELAAPIWGDGTFEIDVTNFDPVTQYSGPKHQVINMYTTDDGSQAVFQTTEAWWNIRTGTNYSTGIKFLAAPIGGDSREEVRLIESATWDPADVHTWKVEWDAVDIDIYLDNSHLHTLPFDGRIEPLTFIFVGKDNVYGGQVGPIYSNLRVTYQP